MHIDVVILNWNRPDDTIKAVQSVLVQDFPDYSILIWDNASTDHSREILNKTYRDTSRVHLHFAQSNYGVAGGRNRAFAQCQGDILFSLDSDATIQNAGALSLIAEKFSHFPDVGALSFEVKRPDGHLMWPFSRPQDMWHEQSFETFRIDGCAFAVRREVFQTLHGFEEHFSPYGAEDAYFALRLLDHGEKILYMPSVHIEHAFNPAGRNQQQFMMHVRNRLWIPAELFPFPQCLLYLLGQLISLYKDAREEKQLAAFIKGIFAARKGFRFAHRKSLTRKGWRYFRKLVKEEKQVAE